MTKYYDWYKLKLEKEVGDYDIPGLRDTILRHRLMNERQTRQAAFISEDNMRDRSQKRRLIWGIMGA